MTVPAVTDPRASNAQIIGIQAMGLSGPDQTAFIAALVATYQAAIADANINAPGSLLFLNAELNALLTQTPAQLATLQPRPGYGVAVGGP